MKHEFLVRLVNETPLAILPAKLSQIEAFLQFRLAGGPAVDYAARRQDPGVQVAQLVGDGPAAPVAMVEYEAAAAGAAAQVGAVAVLPIFGTILPRADAMTDMSGGAALTRIAATFRGLVADPTIKAIVLDIDSPGGSVFGVEEFAAEVYAARSQKRIVAVADHMAASAAYWIASAAEQLVASPSAIVGSVGVVAMHVDYSGKLANDGIAVSYIHAGQYKVEGNPAQPLGDDARAFIQQSVDEYYSAFVGAVARGRGTTASTVTKNFGQGRVFGAEQAKAAGMVDRIATLQEVIRGLQPRRRTTNNAAATAEADIAAALVS